MVLTHFYVFVQRQNPSCPPPSSPPPLSGPVNCGITYLSYFCCKQKYLIAFAGPQHCYDKWCENGKTLRRVS